MNEKWPEKFIIGLTGNIGTGKSLVREMLEHLGARGIDADALSHHAIMPGAPGYKPVVEQFGKWILKEDGQIDRSLLGRIVFSDTRAMKILEGIIHPLVQQGIAHMISQSPQRVIVIEAIKLLEGSLKPLCQSIWVVDVPQDVQVQRLVQKRGISREDALQRITFQGDPAQKLKAAQVIIHNAGTPRETWQQVQAEWKNLFPRQTLGLPQSSIEKPLASQPTTTQITGLELLRGRPRDAAEISGLINRLSRGEKEYTPDEIIAQLGEKAFLLLRQGDLPVGVAAWRVENLIARTNLLLIDPCVELAAALKALTGGIEQASSDLQCEVSMLFLSPSLAREAALLNALGYEARSPQTLGVHLWQDAALESSEVDTTLFFKRLRADRVLRPI